LINNADVVVELLSSSLDIVVVVELLASLLSLVANPSPPPSVVVVAGAVSNGIEVPTSQQSANNDR
jgi:hypothetical protein